MNEDTVSKSVKPRHPFPEPGCDGVRNTAVAALIALGLLLGMLVSPVVALPDSQETNARIVTGPLSEVGLAGDHDRSRFAAHRLNPDQSNPTPEHEVLTCRSIGGSAIWICRYDKRDEPELGFQTPPEGTEGLFLGVRLPANVVGRVCRVDFPFACPDDVAFVIQGVIVFRHPDGSRTVVAEQLWMTDAGVLWVYWMAPHNFICPWYPTFAEALAANPFPLPFNGVDWPANDCIFGVT